MPPYPCCGRAGNRALRRWPPIAGPTTAPRGAGGQRAKVATVLTANRLLSIAKATKAQSKAITGLDHGDPSDIILRLAMMTPNPRQDRLCCWRRPRSALKVTGAERVGLVEKRLDKVELTPH